MDTMKGSAAANPIDAMRKMSPESLQRLRQMLGEKQQQYNSDARFLRILQILVLLFLVVALGIILFLAMHWQLDVDLGFTHKGEAIGLLLTFAAWLSTTAGGALVIFECLVPASDPKAGVAGSLVLPLGLSFAGGIMLTISLGEILGKAEEEFGAVKEENSANNSCMWSPRDVKLVTIGFIIAGGILMLAFHYLVHFVEGLGKQRAADKYSTEEELDESEILKKKAQQLMLMSVISMVAILIHNAPEGIITYFSTVADMNVGISLSIGIIVHNFPEGFLVSLPFLFSLLNLKRAAMPKEDAALMKAYSAYLKAKDEPGKVQVNGNGLEQADAAWRQYLEVDGQLVTSVNVLEGLYPMQRLYAVLFSAISALSEPIAGLIGNLAIEESDMTAMIKGILFGVVAGMMIAVVVYELFPIIAKEDPDFVVSHHGFVVGCFVMLVSIMLMADEGQPACP